MPQMKPMNWVLLYLFMLIIFMLFIMIIFFNKKYKLINNKMKKMMKIKSWMW